MPLKQLVLWEAQTSLEVDRFRYPIRCQQNRKTWIPLTVDNIAFKPFKHKKDVHWDSSFVQQDPAFADV